MSAVTPRKFGFDTEFDQAGDVAFAAPRPKRSYTPEEVETIRAAARAEGERQALGSIAQAQAEALAEISQACRSALPRLHEAAHAHKTHAAELSLACARAIAGAALDRFPEAPLVAAFEALSREIEAQPRLVVSLGPQLAESVAPLLEEAARQVGFAGAVQTRVDGGAGPAAFTLDFGDGQARFDPAAAAERVIAALSGALEAEARNPEPLIPAGEI